MTPRIVGRVEELDELLRLARAAAAGVGGVALVEGEGGIGKTALVDAAVAAIGGELGGRALRGRSWEEGGAPPCWPWPEVAAAGGWAIDWSQGIDPFALGMDVITALSTTAAATDGPLVVVLDDLHAAADDAIRLTRFVARSAAAVPCLLVVAARPSARVRELGREGAHLVLGPLEATDAAALVLATVDGLAPATVDEVCARAEGVPLFLRELARHARAGRSVPRDLPAAVQPIVDALDPSTRGLLEVAAVFGRTCAVDRLAAFVGEGADAVLDALEPLRTAGVLDVTGVPPVVAFSHQLVRDVIYEQLAAGRRLVLHARAAATLAEPADAARHLLAAVPVVDANEAVDGVRRATAVARTRGAHGEAAALGREALALASGPVRLDLLREVGEDLAAGGRVSEAVAMLDDAIAAARAEGDPGRLAAAVLSRTDRVAWGADATARVPLVDDAIVRIDARPVAGGDPDDRERAALAARLRARRAALLATGTDLHAATVAAREALGAARALEPPDDVVLADALAALHRCSWAPERLADALAVGAELVDVAARTGDPDRLSEALLARLIDHLRAGDLAGVDAALDRYAAFAASTGRPRDRYFLLSRQAMRRFVAGDLAVGDHLAGLAYELAQRIEEPDAVQVFHGLRSIVVGELQPPEETAAAAEVAASMARAGEPRLFVHAAAAYLRAGDRAAAGAALDDLRRSFGAIDGRRFPLFELCLVGEVAAACGRFDVAEEVRHAIEPHAGATVVNAGAVTFGGLVDDYLGMLADARGDREEARRRTTVARDVYVALGAPWFAARAERRLGALGEGERGTDKPRPGADASGPPPRVFVLRPQGELWEVGAAGHTTLLRDARGLRHLHSILRAGGQEVAATELVGGAAARELASREAHHALLDERAKSAYRRRITELRAEVDDADADADLERAARARLELDLLVEELTRAVGLGGRDRYSGASSERARVAVRKAIAAATERISAHDPQLAHVLRTSVRTGAWCRYEADPVTPAVWALT